MLILVCEVILFSVVILCDWLVACRSLAKRTPKGISLGITCIGAAIVTTSYIISVFIEDYFWYSVFSSCYFIGIDMTLLSLIYFVRYFVFGGKTHFNSASWRLLLAWSAADTVLLALNPFVELSIHYVHVDAPIAHYVYEMKGPYRMHLLLAYVILATVMFYIVRKAITVPSMYRHQYEYSVATLIVVVLINAVYLYVPVRGSSHILDYSLLGYSLAAILFYWICFSYSEHGMMDLLRDHIFENMDRGLLLFDYEDELLLVNKKADEMLRGYLQGHAPTIGAMKELLAGDIKDLASLGDGQKHTFQCYPDAWVQMRPMMCDYRVLKGGKRNEALGKLFVFSELTSEYDALTGFCMWEVYKKRESSGEASADRVAAVACDINGLSDINGRMGRSGGDRAIQALARLMRKHFAQGAEFVRGGEAVLTAVCDGASEETMHACVDNMRAELAADETVYFDFTSGIKCLEAGGRRSDAVEGAVETLRMRKLLDENSRHSEVLYSLVRMLQACDNDTEAHVRRTRKMCAKLGERIGLTEEQQSNLALLALLHDIGKTGIPLDILNKPGKLTDAEWRVLMTHVQKGYQIASSSPELRGIADMILYHHERWDGKGYPDGLSKESIPLLSRVIAVVDSYDAMTHDRAYRKAITPVEAAAEIKRCAGTQFDPTLASEFLQLMVDDGIIPALPGEDDDIAYSREHAAEPPAQRSLEASVEESAEAPRVHVLHFARYITDGDQRIKSANAMFFELTGYSEQDIEQGLTQLDLIFKEDRQTYLDMVQTEVKKDNIVYLEHWIRRKDGSALFVSCCGRRFYNSAERKEQSEIIVSDSAASYSVQSVVQKEYGKATRRLERWENKFRRDPLTGLLNHEAFKNDVETRLMAGEKRAMMLMMDIDRFKDYNDTYGHRAGDEFLIMVAQTLMGALRNSDFACRMGGDEFAALLFFDDTATQEQMSQRAAQIFDKVNLTLTSLGDGGTSLSMGGAFLGADCGDFDALYEAADRALYRSKDNGRAKLSF